ncbi:hypothetical protein LLEC1_03610 [Akanthomyces lecanii]|uniref:Phosphatidate phosphatase APP1 catalytic domain-containing protein n=1 Tax=Cordyceps confragosa TaxID=2714763 RepID=A0A179I4G1_CORDF|nr:hypothetical protein LLEC1_03610 [Akanthomyces lecanii]
MVLAQKRKPIEDDFIHTISDNDEDVAEEEVTQTQPPKKKAKTAKKAKKGSKAKDASADEEEKEAEGVWGRNEDDDGAMDSDFEFMADNAGEFGEEEFEGWGFDSARKGMNMNKKMVDIDEIIRRRREKRGGVSADTENEDEEVEDDNDEDLLFENGMEMDDDDDEVLAEDAFGMNVDLGSEEEEDENKADGEREEGDEQEEGDASDNDSIATPEAHPDDDDVSDASDQEDAEEEAKRVAFFAPEEKPKAGKEEKVSSFQSMSLSRPILRGLTNVGFSKPTPIQSKTIPIALMGKDLVGGAVTGSGKTGAFIIPILERLLYRPKKIPTTRVVVLTPTRELAIQCHAVATKLAAHTDIKFTLAVGGLSLKMQEAELRLRPDVIIATPGRFIDHMRNSASFPIDTVEILVLDEADRMLEDGFADELNEILTTLPKSRQTMLFSATMTSTVDRLIRVGMNKPARVMVDSQKRTVGTLVQEFVRLRPGRESKRMGYLAHICKTLYTERVIIFFRQKKDAHEARIIFGILGMTCAELHGSMSQTGRIESVEAFRDGKVNYLLATDLASRGLDIKGVDTVINYEAPQSLEIYVHRVGRTARAGRKGVALTLAAESDRKVVKAAVKSGKAQGAKISSRVIEAEKADKLQAQIDGMEHEIKGIMREEKEERQFAAAEMQVRKGENMIEHEAEIKGRPKRTWFETEHDKKKAKEAGKVELNGASQSSKKKKALGKISNKTWVSCSISRPPSDKLALFRFFHPGRLRPQSLQHRLGLLRRAFPAALRQRYHDRLARFHLDTLPAVKYGLRSRVYRYILRRQSRRIERGRVAGLLAQRNRLQAPYPSLAATPQHPRRAATPSDGSARERKIKRQNQMPTSGIQTGAMPGLGSDDTQPGQGERGYRRRKLAEMAGSIYRTGQQAVTDMRESYVQTRARMADTETDGRGQIHIPGAFPDAAITVQGDEHLVLFPSYAKRHAKRDWSTVQAQGQVQEQEGPRDEDYWRQEFEKHEDERAIADVDVRGWIYNPHIGPISRRNRILIGLARQLSGISAPRADANSADSTDPGTDTPPTHHQAHEEQREQEKIEQEAAKIERKGRQEKQAAAAGSYTEEPYGPSAGAPEPFYSRRSRRRGSQTPESAPASPLFGPRQLNVNDLSEAELALANANLMARIAPFMTNPLIALPVTIFFYNDTQSQSRTVLTDDAGHFNIRAALDFVPTHVRVLGNEDLSATQEVQITEPKGVSLISDIDDTVKKSNIASGAREIFRNTFIRELRDLTVEGVQEWYTDMHKQGVMFHYCSNSPWQLFPVLASFFKLGGLPPGSLHLKQYSGMLQGIFEPVAERKKGTLTRLLHDFPDRKFLLVGDSGEADLEVYTDLAIANPGRILAIFIRDVTTTERPGYFDSAYDLTRKRFGSLAVDDGRPSVDTNQKPRQSSAPLVSPIEEKSPAGPAMGTLIDFSEEPEPAKLDDTAALSQVRNKKPVSAADLLGRKAPPPRPAKPAALRGVSSTTSSKDAGLGIRDTSVNAGDIPPPKPPRIKTTEPSFTAPNLSRRSSSKATSDIGDGTAPSSPDVAPPLPRRRGPPSLRNLSPRSRSGVATPSGSPTIGAQGVNKKVDLWRRRVARAHEQLEQLGVTLYTWRKGQDVSAEAAAIIKRAFNDMHK